VISAAGDAELRRASRAGSFGLRYSHGAVEALGLGRALTSDEVGLTHERVWWASVSVRASADHAWLTDPTRPGTRLTTSSVNAEARRSLGGVFWLTAGGFLRRRAQDVVVQNNGVYLGAGFTMQR
jgi:hypothetical protein